jgi:hypothetical protein
MKHQRAHFAVIATSLALLACGDAGRSTDPGLPVTFGYLEANDAATRVYEVTITNLTTGQPFSPGVLVTHTADRRIFQVGSQASEGVRLIAEDGDPAVAFTELMGSAGVFDVVATSAPVGRTGGGPFPNTLTDTISASANANRFSLVVMLICTNDGFAGVNSVRLPGGFTAETFTGIAYDSGTEANDELSTSIVDPCGAIGPVALLPDGNARPATSTPVGVHAGIAGVGDLSVSLHGWANPVVRVRIQRIS